MNIKEIVAIRVKDSPTMRETPWLGDLLIQVQGIMRWEVLATRVEESPTRQVAPSWGDMMSQVWVILGCGFFG